MVAFDDALARPRPSRSSTSSLNRNRSSCASGKRIGAFEFDRVLRRDHQKDRRQRHALALDGHLVLFHRLEERRLGLGRSAIDLVGNDHVGEDRPAAEGERRGCRPERRWCPGCRTASGRA